MGTVADRVKRFSDLFIASILTPLLLPVACVVAILVWLNLGRPILFRQTRVGLEERPFTLYKFRTMRDTRGGSGVLLEDAQRLTPFGALLRRTSLDELPQLFNVFRGEMSLVGPRPLLTHYLPLYTRRQRRRHEVRPGLTGWTQVKGRNELSWEKKLELDVWYVENRSLWLDLKILLLTVWRVGSRRGISQPGHATAEEFKGSNTAETDFSDTSS